MINALQMQKQLAFYFEYWKNPCIPNCYIGGYPQYEMDMAVITKAGYLIEIEIKRSRADFMADQHKDKWKRLKCCQLYYCAPEKLAPVIQPLLDPRFGLLSVTEPDRWGRMYVSSVRKAQRIKGSSKLEPDDIKHLTSKMGYRYWRHVLDAEEPSHEKGSGI